MKPSIMVISSGGGHLREVMIALESYDTGKLLFVSSALPHLQNMHDIDMLFINDAHRNMRNYLRNLAQSLNIYFRYRPSIILSTGAGISVFMFVIGKLMGSRTIFIESGSRILYPSKTGRILYHFSNYFIIQSAPLKKYFPKAILTTVL